MRSTVTSSVQHEFSLVYYSDDYTILALGNSIPQISQGVTLVSYFGNCVVADALKTFCHIDHPKVIILTEQLKKVNDDCLNSMSISQNLESQKLMYVCTCFVASVFRAGVLNLLNWLLVCSYEDILTLLQRANRTTAVYGMTTIVVATLVSLPFL